MSASTDDLPIFQSPHVTQAPERIKQQLRDTAYRIAPIVIKSLSALILPILLFALWWITADRHWIAEQILPSPAFVWQSFKDVIDTGELLEHVGHSVRRAAWSLLIGGGIGLTLGLAMGLAPNFKAYVFPTFKALAQVPVLGWIPLLIIFVGIEEPLKLSAISIAVVVPVALTTLDGIANIPRTLIEVGRVYQFTLSQRILRIVLPAAAPTLFTALRQGVMQAWLSVIFVELLSSSEGLGFFMAYSRSLSQMDMVIVSMFTIGALGIAIELLLRSFETRVQRWRRPAL